MRIAFIHEWLVTYAGSERVLEQMLKCFPEGDLFCLIDFLPAADRSHILNKPVRTTFIQRLPFARTKYRQYLSLMPLAIEQLDLSGYDVIISSSHAVAKGVITGPDQLHICMCYSPMRYAWDLQNQYLRESGLDSGLKGWIAKWMLHNLRLWDAHSAMGVDHFIGISEFIARRIWKVYRRDAKVIYPPVDVESFVLREQKEEFYLAASRMVPYKRMELIVDAFLAMPTRKLVVIGDGPDFSKIRAKAGPNISLLGYQEFQVLRDYMQRAKAFVFAAEEDFGIAPVEAQACGTPVIAYAKGGATETIRGLDCARPTGVFFEAQSVEAIVGAVARFEKVAISALDCRENSLRFSVGRFIREFNDYVTLCRRDFNRRASAPNSPSPQARDGSME
jgi:glycosyltransferase involved in cell wall biosynthesis